MAAQVRGDLKAHAVNIFFEAFEKAAGVLFTGYREQKRIQNGGIP
jgi:hypothetical protein